MSTRLRGGRTTVHVLADDRPDPSFDGADPDLKDVYFIKLAEANGGGGEAVQGGGGGGAVPGGGSDSVRANGRRRIHVW